MSSLTFAPEWNGDSLRIAIVRARFNEAIGLAEEKAALAELTACGVDPAHIVFMSVPGALELGVVLQQLGDMAEFDAIIALGAVIRGETYHFELVSNESAAAIGRVARESGLPIMNGVLTTDTEAQALARAADKGRECARGAVEMINLMEKLRVLQRALLDDDDDDDDEDYDDDLDDIFDDEDDDDEDDHRGRRRH